MSQSLPKQSKGLNTFKIASIAVLLATTGCASVNHNSNTANYKIQDKSLKAIETDVNQRILESSITIQKQLELLNEIQSNKQPSGKTVGKQADYRVNSHLNIKDITPKDVEVMINEGRSLNNPHPQYDKLIPNGVTPEKISASEKANLENTKINQVKTKNFYKVPVQDANKQIDLSKYWNSKGQKLKPLNTDFIHNEQTTNVVENTVKQEKPADQSQKNKNMKALERGVTLSGEYKTTDLLKQLSKGAGYKFSVIGVDKNLTMTIGTEQKPFKGTIKEALIGVGNGFGDNAVINVSTTNKTITVEYK